MGRRSSKLIFSNNETPYCPSPIIEIPKKQGLQKINNDVIVTEKVLFKSGLSLDKENNDLNTLSMMVLSVRLSLTAANLSI